MLTEIIQHGSKREVLDGIAEFEDEINTLDDNGRLPIEVAIEHNIVVLKYLIPKVNLYTLDCDGVPYIAAAMLRSCEDGENYVISALLDGGLSPDTYVNLENRVTLLMKSSYSSLDVTRILLRAGADVSIRDCTGNTAIMYAVDIDRSDGGMGDEEIYAVVAELLQYGSSVDDVNINGLGARDILAKQSWNIPLRNAILNNLLLEN